MRFLGIRVIGADSPHAGIVQDTHDDLRVGGQYIHYLTKLSGGERCRCTLRLLELLKAVGWVGGYQCIIKGVSEDFA